MRTLVWFRSDLRTRDNTALSQAAQAASSHSGTVGVFTICPEQWQEHDWAAVRVNLLLSSLQALQEALSAKGILLKVMTVPRFAGVPAALLELAAACDWQALYYSREYEWNEQQRDVAVARRFRAHGIEVHTCDDQVVFRPGSVQSKPLLFHGHVRHGVQQDTRENTALSPARHTVAVVDSNALHAAAR